MSHQMWEFSNTSKRTNRLQPKLFTVVAIFFLASCGSTPPPKTKPDLSELETPDEIIPWQRSGKISTSSLSVAGQSPTSRPHENIDFKKTEVEYPLAPDLKVLISSVEFHGDQPEVWANWNQQIFHTVEKIKNALRRNPELEKNLRLLGQGQNNKARDGRIEVHFNSVEISITDIGYELLFISEIPSLFEHKLDLVYQN